MRSCGCRLLSLLPGRLAPPVSHRGSHGVNHPEQIVSPSARAICTHRIVFFKVLRFSPPSETVCAVPTLFVRPRTASRQKQRGVDRAQQCMRCEPSETALLCGKHVHPAAIVSQDRLFADVVGLYWQHGSLRPTLWSHVDQTVSGWRCDLWFNVRVAVWCMT